MVENDTGQISRVKTRIMGLDDKLQGGIPEGFTVVITGPVGSLKSSIAFSILYHAALEGTDVIYFSLEQMTSSLIQQMGTMNMDFDKVKDRMTLLDIGILRRGIGMLKETPLEKLNWSNSILSQLKSYTDMVDLKICVIDSVNVLNTLTHDKELRTKMFHFFRELKELNITVIMLAETPDGQPINPETDLIRYLADGVLSISVERKDRSCTRILQVTKMRATFHSGDWCPLLFDNNKFKILTK